METAKKSLSFILIVLMMLGILPQSARAATVRNASTPAQLESAFSDAVSGDTIKLLADIDYGKRINVNGKFLTLDTNGYKLNVEVNDYALYVQNNGEVILEGSGEFNVKSTYGSGVFATSGGRATVTSATVEHEHTDFAAAHAVGAGSYIKVIRDAVGITSNNVGAAAESGGSVIVEGNAEGGYCGALISHKNSFLQVNGNVISSSGYAVDCLSGKVKVNGNATGKNGVYTKSQFADVKIAGDVTATGNLAYGVHADGGVIKVTGRVIANGEESIGVWALSGGAVTIDGTIRAPVYIVLGFGEVVFEPSDGEQGDPPDDGYLIYSLEYDQIADTVRVKINEYVCEINDVPYTSFDAALSAAIDGDTIRLLKNIEYSGGIAVIDRTLTIDTNGKDLNVTNAEDHALKVGYYGVVNLEGSGTFNVKSEAENGNGVYTYFGGRATVTSATATGENGAGAWASGDNSYIQVIGDAAGKGIVSYGVFATGGGVVNVGGSAEGTAYVTYAIGTDSSVHVAGDAVGTGLWSIAALAESNGKIEISGNASGGEYGAYADGAGSIIIITGDTLASDSGGYGAFSFGGGTVDIGGDADGHHGVSANELNSSVTVAGNVTATGNLSFGVSAVNGAVTVGGNITANGSDSIGAWAGSGGTITVDGTITAPKYIRLQGTYKTAVQGVPDDPPYQDYLKYSDGTSIVRVKRRYQSAEINPNTASFYKNPANQADVVTYITWNDASSVTGIKTGGVSIGVGSYSVSGNKLTIKKEYLAGQPVGDIVLSIEFDKGNPATLTITISDSAPPAYPQINPVLADFDKYSPQDISVAMTLNGHTLLSIKNGAEILSNGEDYTVSGDTAVIKKEYLSQQVVGTTVLTFDFNAGTDPTLTVNISDSSFVYPLQTLTDPESEISVSGSILEGAVLQVTELDPNSEAYNKLEVALNDGEQIILSFDISLSSDLHEPYTGELTLSFFVGTQYNGQTLTVLHDTGSSIERYIGVVTDGILTITVSSLSPYAVAESEPISGLPQRYTMFEGGRVTWAPTPTGGTWQYNTEYFTATANGNDMAFKAIKAGNVTISYTVNGITHSIDVTVLESQLPATGQDNTLLWVLGILIVLSGIAAVFVMAQAKRKLKH